MRIFNLKTHGERNKYSRTLLQKEEVVISFGFLDFRCLSFQFLETINFINHFFDITLLHSDDTFYSQNTWEMN